MTQYYTVAGHSFRLCMADENALCTQLSNYTPFLSEEQADILFSLNVSPDNEPLFDEKKARHILTDKTDEDMPRIELYEQDGQMLFRISVFREAPVCFEMRCTTDYQEAEVVILTECGRFPVDNALMLLYAFRTAAIGTLEMHASVIQKDGKSYLFLGHSGTGKSTHSRQWLAAFPDARLLNDDNPIVRVPVANNPWNEGKPFCFGSPWSGKTPCYHNEEAPIAGIVLLRQAPENRMQRLSLPEAYAAVYSSSSGLRCNPQMAEGLHNTVAALVTSVPVCLLDCLPNEDAARLCHDTLTKLNP